MGERACTPMSVANHSLHENPSPVRHVEPGGVLDTSECRFEAVSPKATLVTGMRWLPAETYTVKIVSKTAPFIAAVATSAGATYAA